MVFIPAGKFWRGSCNEQSSPSCTPKAPGYTADSSAESLDADETPLKEIYLDSFYIDTFEVTVSQYKKCVDAEACGVPGAYAYCNDLNESTYENHPVNCVSWFNAREYCEFVGKRLPTEAEWEKAARGTDGREYPWGNDVATCEYAVINDGGTGCGKDSTWPIGSKQKGVSPYGVYDMAGNVWEWVADWYSPDYYSRSPDNNPEGPDSGSERVLRGGSWGSYAGTQRSAFRVSSYPDYLHYFLFGFRCLLPSDS